MPANTNRTSRRGFAQQNKAGGTRRNPAENKGPRESRERQDGRWPQNEIDTLKIKVNDAEIFAQRLQAELADTNETIRSRKSKMDTLNAEVIELEAKYDGASRDLRGGTRDEQIAYLQQSLVQAENGEKRMKEEMEETLRNLNDQLGDLDQQLCEANQVTEDHRDLLYKLQDTQDLLEEANLNRVALEERKARELAEKDECLQQELSQMDALFGKELAEREERHKEELAQLKESFELKFSEQQEALRRDLSERKEKLNKRLAGLEDNLSLQLEELEERYRKASAEQELKLGLSFHKDRTW